MCFNLLGAANMSEGKQFARSMLLIICITGLMLLIVMIISTLIGG